MNEIKVAIIGAGSTYTPELINGFIMRKGQLNVSTFYLMDIDYEKMEIVAGLAKRMLQVNGMKSEVVLTTYLEEALVGVDYVIGQIRVGGLDARINDEKIPLKHNLIGQETTGAGGFMNALRTIPAIMDIANAMERLAPEAWLINFSNPSGIMAEAVLNNTSIKMLGLCNGPINMLKNVMTMIPEGTKEIEYDFVGLNHLCWITALYADGKEILQDNLIHKMRNSGIENTEDYYIELFRLTCGYHIGYLNYYYFKDEQLKQLHSLEKTRGEICKEIENSLLELYKNPDLNEKPTLLDKRGGALYSDAAVSLIDAIENDKNEIHVVDVLNSGAFSFMDKNDVVETKCLINRTGATPIKLKNYNNKYVIGMIRTIKAYEKLAVKAGLDGDYSAALGALMLHPLVGDYHKAKSVLEDMLAVNRKYLPRFFERSTK